MQNPNGEWVILSPGFRLRGEFKAVASIRLETDFTGSITTAGKLAVPSFVKVIAEVKADSIQVEPGANLTGKLQIGSARAPWNQLRGWFRRATKWN
jgi:cytoskeletal protein CcmA (bactofilin family)